MGGSLEIGLITDGDDYEEIGDDSTDGQTHLHQHKQHALTRHRHSATDRLNFTESQYSNKNSISSL